MNIAIVGAGIGGVACASALARVGINAHIYEQAHQFSRVGAGIQMGPNATHVLHGLGLKDQLANMAFQPKTNLNKVWDSGEITNDYPLSEHVIAKYGAPFYALHRADLHESLANLVPCDQIHLNKKLVSLDQDDDGVVLIFEDGTKVQADAVIGADGVHSLVREILLGPEEPRFTGKVAYRTTYPASLLKGVDIGDSRTKWWGPDRHIVIYYVTRKRDEIYFVTSMPEEASWLTKESWSAKGDLKTLQEAYSGFHSDVQAVISACPEVHKWALFDRDPLPTWVKGRILLVGDACHPMTPYMAQGAAMALEDSVVLARCLDSFNGQDINTVFNVFESIRKPRTSEIQKASGANQWMQNKTNPDWVYGYNAWNIELKA